MKMSQFLSNPWKRAHQEILLHKVFSTLSLFENEGMGIAAIAGVARQLHEAAAASAWKHAAVSTNELVRTQQLVSEFVKVA